LRPQILFDVRFLGRKSRNFSDKPLVELPGASLYEEWHRYPLTEVQRADLAQRITAIHTMVFTVPAAFVHVRFANYAATEHYMGARNAQAP
jgi:phenylpyruvate tautomerase PptA (4-oxalocrotonate tautomerase family)